MITLLHGDYIEASRSELIRMRERAQARDIREIDGRTVDEQSLTQAIQSTSLFGDDVLVVIERMFGKLGKQPKKIASLASVLQSVGNGIDIILWEDKEIGKTIIAQLGKDVAVRAFTLPVLIFALLDSIKPNNASALLSQSAKVMQTEAPELIHSMLVKRVRQLIVLRDGGSLSALAPWQLQRLTSQAKSFTLDQLLRMYEYLYSSEVRIKTGMSPYTMAEHIEQFFLSI